MSMIDPKYRDKYKGDKDWLSTLLDAQVVDPVTKTKETTEEDGTKSTEEVVTKKTVVNLPKLFALARHNGFETEKYEAQADLKNAPGRLRMTIGNMLRAAAKKRHGLNIVNADGEVEWADADAAFIADHERTQERNGTKIAKAKAVETETA